MLGSFREAERRLAQGKSRAAVAAGLHLDWRTVDRIARGKHPWQRARSKFVRCPKCGGLVLLPCQLCLAEQQHRHRNLPPAEVPIGLPISLIVVPTPISGEAA